MIHVYNLRWKENEKWCSQDSVNVSGAVMTGDIVLTNSACGSTLALRVMQRVLTDPVTLICAKTVNPFEDVVE